VSEAGAGPGGGCGQSPAGWVWLLSRPLAGDEHRVRFWIRHVQLGVVLTELAAIIVACYALAAHRPQQTLLLVIAIVLMAAVPAVLALPMRRLCRDHRGALVFYAWTVATTALICAVSLIDGGAASPLTWLLVLTLTYAGLAYPPLGVAAMGLLMIGAYLSVCAAAPAPSAHTAVTTSVLALFTVMVAWASRNQWDMADQQALLAGRLAALADTDPLTSCVNRRAFTTRLAAELACASPTRPVSLCLLDLDGFKAVNDSAGHAAGDRILLTTARVLRTAARETDTVARLGGDEFAVLLPDTCPGCAAAAGQRLADQITAAGTECGVTASIGIVTTSRAGSADALLAAADQLMYVAKHTGRGRISQQQPTPGGCDRHPPASIVSTPGPEALELTLGSDEPRPGNRRVRRTARFPRRPGRCAGV